MSWVTTDIGSSIQVIPLEDTIEHRGDSLCLCYPTVTWIGFESCQGKCQVRKLYTHHAMDGRE